MEDICSYALGIGQERSNYVEVKAERSFSNEIVLKNGKPETSGFDISYGLSVRVVVDGALGFSSTNNLERENVRAVVEDACSMAKAASRLIKRPISFSEEERHSNVSYRVKERESAIDISPEDKLGLLKEINGSIPGDVRLAGNLMNLNDDVTEKHYINSEGSSIHSLIPKISFFGFFNVIENGDSAQAMLEKGASKGWEAVEEWGLGDYVSEEISVLKNVLGKGKNPPKGSMDVLCGPEVTGIASHESCGHPYEADRILGREAAQAGESFVSLDMMGTRIGSDIVTLVDDPTIENSYGYYLYDDEGVKAKKRHLIREGIINELLHNRETAGQLGLKSNGSARCNSYDREPIIRMANTFVEAGDWKKDEIIEDTKRGVLINSFTEWNIDDRRYNQKYVSREAYLIEEGEIRYPLKKVSLELTTPKFWSSVDAVADDVRFFAGNCGKGEPMQGIPVFMGGPTIRLHDIDMGGSL
ncbi:MAG: TldD/PmbA family protein [Candidatus Methanofastidiosa archaeon]|nr:TldD/PmbA family protein [Candidatus Methanofastidiosa archaeon]